MDNTLQLLDQAKRAAGIESDYAFGQRFGVSRQVVSSWRQKKATFSDSHAAMIAEILGREPGEVMALCAAERAKDEGNRSRWLRVAALLAAVVVPPAAGAAVDNNTVTGSIMRATVCQLWELRRKWMPARPLVLA